MVIVETSLFTRRVRSLLDDDEYQLLQLALVQNPHAGTVIQGTGGLRKLRWSGLGRGKRGGVRIIYYWFASRDRLLMLMIFAKNEQVDLTSDQRKSLRSIVEEELK